MIFVEGASIDNKSIAPPITIESLRKAYDAVAPFQKDNLLTIKDTDNLYTASKERSWGKEEIKVGQRIDRVIIEDIVNSSDLEVYLECKCDCGNVGYYPLNYLNTTMIVMCDTCRDVLDTILDRIGQSYGKMTIRGYTYGSEEYLAECECGNFTRVKVTISSGNNVPNIPYSCGKCSVDPQEISGYKPSTKRRRVLRVPNDVIKSLIVRKYEQVWFPTFPDVPEDATLISVNYEWKTDDFYFTFEHPSFEEIYSGDESPVTSPIYALMKVTEVGDTTPGNVPIFDRNVRRKIYI